MSCVFAVPSDHFDFKYTQDFISIALLKMVFHIIPQHQNGPM